MDKVIVGIAEGKTISDGHVLVSYALGSCVGICLYDAGKKLAGMAHIVLPDSENGVDQKNPYKYASTGITALIHEMEVKGARKERMTAKIAGGANMFQGSGGKWEIGKQNIASVKRALEAVKIPVIAEDTGKNYGRTIVFSAENGSLEVNTVRREKKVI